MSQGDTAQSLHEGSSRERGRVRVRVVPEQTRRAVKWFIQKLIKWFKVDVRELPPANALEEVRKWRGEEPHMVMTTPKGDLHDQGLGQVNTVVDLAMATMAMRRAKPKWREIDVAKKLANFWYGLEEL